MDILKLLADIPGTTTTCPFLCRDGVIKISFARDKVLPASLGKWTEFAPYELLQVLDQLTHRVTMTIKSPETKNKEVQLTMPIADAVEILGGEVPSDSNFTRICRRFLDRKHHGGASPAVEPAERSMNAQGQTKKPGSHSHDKHK
jgi:hypothetical protein